MRQSWGQELCSSSFCVLALKSAQNSCHFQMDQQALVEALQAGKLCAVGLDSFANEPLTVAHIFSGLPNVVLTPHSGGVSSDAYVNMGTAAARNVLTVLAGAIATSR